MIITRIQSYWVNFRYKKEVLLFLPFYIFFWYWFYQIPYENFETKEDEYFLSLSGFIAVFPSAIISSMVFFFLSSRLSQWLKPMMKLVFVMSQVDGNISIKEKKAMEKTLNKQFGYFRIKKAIRYFDEFEKNEDFDIVLPCKQLNSLFGKSEMTVFINFLVSIAISDQYLSLKEESLLKEICIKLGISPNSLFLILERRSFISESASRKRYKTNDSRKINSNNRYKILGLESSATLIEAKKAYRELVKIYHPDKIRDKKLKESAKIQFQAITDAYETIKKEKR